MRRIAALSVLILTLTACAERGPSAPTDSGIRGIVLVGPMCPVIKAGSPCPDRPMAADIQVTRNGEVVTTVRSRSDGRFSVDLSPGDYVLLPVQPSPGGLPFAKPVPVTVEPHRFTAVRIEFDSGIR